MKTIGRILLAGIAYVVGVVLTGMLTAALHLPAPVAPPGTTEAQLFRNLVIATVPLAAALLPLATGLRGTRTVRLLGLAFLLFVALGVNTAIEARIFSNLVSNALVMTLEYMLPALLTAAVLTWPAPKREDTTTNMVRFSPAAWSWRVIVAWLAFPVIYLMFGMMVAPIVVPYYNAGVAGLKIPPMNVILGTQLVRSALFLLASLPLIMLWNKSRAKLILAMGLAHTLTVGVFGLAQAAWFPTVLRVTHSLEITADSFVYAAVLALLFTRSSKAIQPQPLGTKAVAGHN